MAAQTFEFDGEVYRLDVLPAIESKVVICEKGKLLGAVDLKNLISDLGRVGDFVRIAYHGARAAGPRHTELQLEIRDLARNILGVYTSSVLTIPRTVLTDISAIHSYLLDGLEEMALETLSEISNIAGEIEATAHKLKDQSDKVERMTERVLLDAMVRKGEQAASAPHLHEATQVLKELSAVTMHTEQFWQQMQDHCRALAETADRMKFMVEKAMKYVPEKRQRIWTSMGFKRKAIQFYAGWVALNSVYTTYVEHIKLTQKDLYEYLRENPSYEESHKSLKELAEKFLADIKQEQKAIANKDFEEIRALSMV